MTSSRTFLACAVAVLCFGAAVALDTVTVRLLRQTLRHVSMLDREGVCTLQVNPPAGPIVGYVSEKARQFRGCVVLVA